MFGLVRALLEKRTLFHQEVEELIETYGADSPAEARRRAMAETDPCRDARAWRIVSQVEKRLNIDRHPDTATRWLEARPGSDTSDHRTEAMVQRILKSYLPVAEDLENHALKETVIPFRGGGNHRSTRR